MGTQTSRAARPPSANIVYILAPGHSGSTLANLMLGSHPKACAVSELTYFPANILQDESCTCGQRMRSCPHWREVAGRLGAKIGYDVLQSPRQFDLGYIDAPHGPYRATRAYRHAWKLRRVLAYAQLLSPLRRRRFVNRTFHDGIDNRLALYDSIREASGADVVVDASKEYLHGLAVYARQPARTRLILLTRDGRAVFHSNLKRGFDREYSMRVWRNYYQFASLALTRVVDPAHVFRMRYEDLAGDPASTLRAACEFIGMSFDESMLDTAWRTHHIVSGNNMRFGKTDIRLDIKWRSELKEVDRLFFDRAAGRLNRQLGYD